MKVMAQSNIREVIGWWIFLVTIGPAAYLGWHTAIHLTSSEIEADTWVQTFGSIAGGAIGAGGAAWAVIWQANSVRRLEQERRDRLVGFFLKGFLPFPYPVFSSLGQLIKMIPLINTSNQESISRMVEIFEYGEISPEMRLQLANLAPDILVMVDEATKRLASVDLLIVSLSQHIVSGPGFARAKHQALNGVRSIVLDLIAFYEELNSTGVVSVGQINSSREELTRMFEEAMASMFNTKQ